jgi:hypothetical protein
LELELMKLRLELVRHDGKLEDTEDIDESDDSD